MSSGQKLPQILSEAHTQQLRESVRNCHTGPRHPQLEALNFVTVTARKKQSLLPSTDQNCPVRMPVFQCFSPPARWPFLEFNTGATPSFPPPPSSSSFSFSSPPHHLFSEVDDVYIASSGCSGGRLDPNPIASSGCCEGRLDRTPYRERRMLWRAPGPEIMPERMPKRRKNVRMEYQIYVR